jgi:hypothetical protein
MVKLRCLIFLALQLNFEEITAEIKFALMSPVVTPFGEWNSWQECDQGTFVTNFDVFSFKRPRKLNPKLEDDMGLISIVLECSAPAGTSGSDKSNFIFTEVGGVLNNVNYTKPVENGDIRVEVNVTYSYPFRTGCAGVIIGAAYMTQPEQIAVDNIAVSNVRFYCSELLDNTPQYVEGYGRYAGEWSESLQCRTKQGICGIQTLAESIYEDGELK